MFPIEAVRAAEGGQSRKGKGKGGRPGGHKGPKIKPMGEQIGMSKKTSPILFGGEVSHSSTCRVLL